VNKKEKIHQRMGLNLQPAYQFRVSVIQNARMIFDSAMVATMPVHILQNSSALIISGNGNGG
jgi:hypothetical protein